MSKLRIVGGLLTRLPLVAQKAPSHHPGRRRKPGAIPWRLTVLLVLAVLCPVPISAAEPAANTNTVTEALAKTNYDAALKALQDAETALNPLREAMQKADKAYATARSAADIKRQQATDAKYFAGDGGIKELQQAEANLASATKALAEATAAKPALDKEASDNKAAATPLQQAHDAVERAAREAEASAKVALDAANRLEIEAKRATTQAATLRRTADNAKATLARAQQGEQSQQTQIEAARKRATEAEAEKKAADEALAGAKSRIAATAAACQAAEEAAAKAEADAAKVRKNVDSAKAAHKEAQAALPSPQNAANAAAQKYARATAQLNLAEAQLAGTKKQASSAGAAAQSAEQAAATAEKAAEEKKATAASAAAKRKAASEAPLALAQAQKAEEAAQAGTMAATRKLSEAEGQRKSAPATLGKVREKAGALLKEFESADKAAKESAAKARETSEDAPMPEADKKAISAKTDMKRKTAEAAKSALEQARQSEKTAQEQGAIATQKLAEAQSEKKQADQKLANAKANSSNATSANQAAQAAAKEFLQLEETSQQTAAMAAAQRKLANDAKAILSPKAKAAEQAAVKANSAAQTLERADARKKSTEQSLQNLKSRIAAAKQTQSADEEAANQAEAAAAPLKTEAEKTRAAYSAASNVADGKRSESEQAKAALYRLAASSRIAKLMESPDPAKPSNPIDDLVFAKLKPLGIQPILCSEAVFVRRAYLDVTGTLPSAEEARAFIQSSEKNKRIALIDELLERSSHVDYWAMKWSDVLRIKAEFPVKVWPNAAQAYHRWVWESVARNKPYDKFARELLTSSGSNFRVGEVNFYRAIQDKTPEGIASAVGLALMGTRAQLWPADRRAAMGAFFSQVGYKPTSEWKEEIVFWDPLHSVALPGSTAAGVDTVAKAVTATSDIARELPKPISENEPLSVVFPDGAKTTVPATRDPREAFADWLIRPENPWFAKAIVNRTWAWIMGRGIIHEADDIREGNAPSNPELLGYLEKELISSGYNLKHIRRLIFTSTTYQLSPIAKHEGPEAKGSFANYLMRRIDAEVLNDAVNNITGSADLYTSAVPEPFTYIPKELTAVEVADGSITSSFLTLFGRSARGTGMESERVNEMASPQWLYMLNSSQMQTKIQAGSKLSALLAASSKPNEIAEKLYLTILSRFPTEADVKAVEEYARTGVTKGKDAWMDLAWALINSPEFLLRH